jgi:hypothetical protein
MKAHIKSFIDYELVYEVHSLLNESHSTHEVEHILEFFNLGSAFKKVQGFFTNPFIKRSIEKELKEILKINVELAKLSLGEDDESFEDTYAFDDSKYDKATSPRSSSSIDVKRSSLEDKKQAIEDKLDILAGESESLKRYLEIAKLNTRIQANELIYKLADTSQKRVLAKFNKNVKLDLQRQTKDLIELGDEYE